MKLEEYLKKQMYKRMKENKRFFNAGILNIADTDVLKLINKLIEKGIIDNQNDVDITRFQPNMLSVILGGRNILHGDIKIALSEAVSELKTDNVIVNGQVSYIYKQSGVYDIVNGELTCYSSDEWTIKKSLEQQEIIGQPLAEKILAKIKEIQIIPGLPVNASIALEEIAKLVKK